MQAATKRSIQKKMEIGMSYSRAVNEIMGIKEINSAANSLDVQKNDMDLFQSMMITDNVQSQSLFDKNEFASQ